jgi:hypothetical protein
MFSSMGEARGINVYLLGEARGINVYLLGEARGINVYLLGGFKEFCKRSFSYEVDSFGVRASCSLGTIASKMLALLNR